MKISAQHGRRWRLPEIERAGGDGPSTHRSSLAPRALPRSQAPLPTPSVKVLIANPELEFRVSCSKQRTETKSNRKKTRVLRAPWCIAVSHSDFSGVFTRHSSLATEFSNRNSRFTGFRSTCSKRTIKQNSNRNKNGFSAISTAPSRHRFLSASLPPRLAAARFTRYNSGSHIEVNQP